jgi:hypothetical protein
MAGVSSIRHVNTKVQARFKVSSEGTIRLLSNAARQAWDVKEGL